jgi:recombinational DNA repair protein (RecF pathway)
VGYICANKKGKIMKYELKNIKVLGYTTDFQQCECCGKENLKGTVSILDLNTDVVLHFGTTCAINADKYDSLNALNEAKKQINSEKRYFQNAKQFAGSMAVKLKIWSNELKREKMIADFMQFIQVKENRLKRFEWEKYQN